MVQVATINIQEYWPAQLWQFSIHQISYIKKHQPNKINELTYICIIGYSAKNVEKKAILSYGYDFPLKQHFA